MLKFKIRAYTKYAMGIIILSMVILYGCRRSNDQIDEGLSPTIASLKKWFNDEIVSKEKQILSRPYSELPSSSPIRRFMRMAGIGNRLNWRNGLIETVNGESVVSVPVDDSKTVFDNTDYKAARSLVFYKDRAGNQSMMVIEFLSTKNGTIKGNLNDLSLKVSQKYLYGTDLMISHENVQVIIYNSNYKRIAGYFLKNGRLHESGVNLQNKNGQPKERAVPLLLNRTTCSTCQTWFLVGIIYDIETGNVLDYIILDTWDECTESGGNDDPPAGYGTSPEVPETCMTEEQAGELGSAWLEASTNDNDLTEINQSGEFPGQLPGEITKTKSFKWRCGGGTLLGYSWSYYSTEIGGLKKVTSTSPWQFVSFTHQNIGWVGTAPGNVSISTNSAIATVVSAQLAEINLDWDVTLTIDCLGVTVFSSSKNHTNYNFFGPNDVP